MECMETMASPDKDSSSPIVQLDVLILMQLARMKAVGSSSISDFDLKQQLPAVEFDELTSQLMSLAKRLFIDRRVESGQVRLSLTPLGAALARELEAAHLEKLSDQAGP
jgi:DNA-binding HxlR family transcriptional regulator